MSEVETCLFLSAGSMCSQGLFGGNPTEDNCRGCEKKVPITVRDGKRVFSSLKREDLMKASQGGIQKPTDKSRGLGDTVAKMTKAVGVKPCGKCKKRQAALNKMFPYKDKQDQDGTNIKPDTTDNG
tara:strand:+ start:146 stop:523 length:378 start_codon:yes stop_codon:yes gene_type:complete